MAALYDIALGAVEASPHAATTRKRRVLLLAAFALLILAEKQVEAIELDPY